MELEPLGCSVAPSVHQHQALAARDQRGNVLEGSIAAAERAATNLDDDSLLAHGSIFRHPRDGVSKSAGLSRIGRQPPRPANRAAALDAAVFTAKRKLPLAVLFHEVVALGFLLLIADGGADHGSGF